MVFKKVATVLFGFLVVASGINSIVRKAPFIPDNAQIVVFPEKKEWIPYGQPFSKRLFAGLPPAEMGSYLIPTLTTAKEIKSGGKYEDFTIPRHWDTYRDNYKWGQDRGILEDAIFRPKGRWNEDGSWNY